MYDDPNPMIEALRKLVAEEQAYPLEAYCFLYQALDQAQREAGVRRHVSGPELLHGARQLAIDLFGPLTLMVFNHWGLVKTRDFGEMVFHLVDRELMGRTDDDRLEDFDDVFDFEEVFAPDNLIAQVESKLEPSPRLHGRRPNLSSRSGVKQG